MPFPIYSSATFHRVKSLRVTQYMPENDHVISISLAGHHADSCAEVTIFGLPADYARALVDALAVLNGEMPAPLAASTPQIEAAIGDTDAERDAS